MPQEAYKLSVCVPEEYLESLMDSIDEVMEPFYPGYRRCFSIIKCKGTWKPVEGAHPFKGEVGKIEIADEFKIEFLVKKYDLKKVLNTIVKNHPYEEPAIDVIPCFGWKSFIGPRP